MLSRHNRFHPGDKIGMPCGGVLGLGRIRGNVKKFFGHGRSFGLPLAFGGKISAHEFQSPMRRICWPP